MATPARWRGSSMTSAVEREPSATRALDLVRPASGNVVLWRELLCEIRRFEAPLCEGDVRFKILLHSQARSAVLHPALRKQRF